jgi:hypothetical protein
MQLFYHGTRDIELPGAGRRGPPPAASRQCETCGRALSESEASNGGAQALALCGECRRRMDRSAIQIHFCDACGVSVPLEDVEEGRALAADGRILCPACRTANPPEGAVLPRVLWLVVLALALGAIAAALV